MNGGFWKGKRVLVTGHTGFKGAWLCHWLLRAGSDVMGYALPPPHVPSLFALTKLDTHVRHHVGDIRDPETLRPAVRSFQPEIVFHMAAQSLVLESYRDPIGTLGTNVMGTAHVLDALRGASELQACVVVTSDKCYADHDPTRSHSEDDPMGGSDPYSASKGCAELVTAAYRSAFFDGDSRVASARAGNVIGGGDWSTDRLVPDIVRALTDGTTLKLRRPDAVRPWQHVLEPLSGYVLLAERLAAGDDVADGWNFGPDAEEPWRVRDVVHEFVETWGAEHAGGIEIAPSPFGETDFLALDSSKARKQLRWAPRWSVASAIRRTVAWYHALYLERAEAQALVDDELNEYLSAEQAADEVGGAQAER